MGYSIAIRARNQELRDRMMGFLDREYQPYGDGAGLPSSDLSYDRGSKATTIGFDYRSGLYGWEREYVYSMLRWMALKIGKRRFFKDVGDSCPYMVYDGEEAWPILVWEKGIYLDCHRWAGVTPLGQAIELDFDLHPEETDMRPRIGTELERLDRLWKETSGA